VAPVQSDSDPTAPLGLPTGCFGRLVVGVLAVWILLVFTAMLAGFLTVYIPWPPPNVGDLVVLMAICHLLAMGIAFSVSAIVWSIARPRWIERRLVSAPRRLASATGIFMLGCGVTMTIPALGSGLPIAWVVTLGALVAGVGLLVGAGRLAAAGH